MLSGKEKATNPDLSSGTPNDLLLFLCQRPIFPSPRCAQLQTKVIAPPTQCACLPHGSLINTCPGMQGKSVTQQAPPTGRREASHGGRRPSLIAKDDLPVATSDCSWRHGNREQQVAAPPGKSFGLTECLLRYPMSGLLSLT